MQFDHAQQAYERPNAPEPGLRSISAERRAACCPGPPRLPRLPRLERLPERSDVCPPLEGSRLNEDMPLLPSSKRKGWSVWPGVAGLGGGGRPEDMEQATAERADAALVEKR